MPSIRHRHCWLLLAALLAAPASFAHTAIDQQLARLSQRIDREPRAAHLYLARGELNRELRRWDAAVADFERAAELAPGPDAGWRLGRLLLEAGQLARARQLLARLVTQHPRHAQARLTLARALRVCGEPLAAAREYTRALELMPPPARPRPDDYLERAAALVAAGEPHLAEALRGLDEGYERLGATALALEALELELRLGRQEAALERIEMLAASAARPARWTARRAELLEATGHRAEALAVYRQALEEQAEVPAERRRNRASRELEQRLRAALERLENQAAPEPEARAASTASRQR